MASTRTKLKKRLLLVEDNRQLLEAMAISLEQQGFEVMTARCGNDAFVSIAETLPDLIISDVMMPQGDGFSLVKNLRSNPRTELIPIVFLTAKDGRKNRLNGVRAGVDAYLTKPFEPEELVVTIENILDRVKRTQTRVALNANSQLGKSTASRSLSKNTNPSDLTEAELRIARLVGDGLSNKEVAAHFKLSVRTVESHVSSILSKKGFSNRVEIARYISRQSS